MPLLVFGGINLPLSRLIFASFSILLCSSALALEYLSDSELANLDGYTSSFMQKEYDSEGNVIFRRGDNEPCRYAQSDNDDDARLKCEESFETEYDRILGENFQRYLNQALSLMQADPELDVAGDGLQNLHLSVRLENFDYNHFMCDGMPDKGVIRFEGISLIGEDGGDFTIDAQTRIDNTYNENTGEFNRVIVSESKIKGRIGVDAIKIGNSIDDAKSAPSLGGVYVRLGDSTMRISRTED